jgi:tetratricopeptide (TPR) repeat protein
LSEAYAVLGVSLTWLGRYDEALIQCDRAVRMRPDDADVRLALGRILDQQGRHDEAVESLKRAIDLTPKDARVHRAIAQAYMHRAMKGNQSDFIIAYKETDIALRLSPQDANSHWVAGQIYEAANAAGVELPLPSGKAIPTIDQAKERYQTALSIDPGNARAKAAMQVFIDAEAKAKAEADAKAQAEADAKAAADAKAEADAKAAADAKANADAAIAQPTEEAKPETAPAPEAAPETAPALAP